MYFSKYGRNVSVLDFTHSSTHCVGTRQERACIVRLPVGMGSCEERRGLENGKQWVRLEAMGGRDWDRDNIRKVSGSA